MEDDMREKRFIKRIILIGLSALIIVYFKQVTEELKNISSILFPLLLGFIFAYVINLLMKFLEKYYFPRSKNKWVQKTKRPICVLLSYILIILIIVLVINLVLPQVIDTLTELTSILPIYFNELNEWIDDVQEEWPTISKWLGDANLNWSNISNSIINYATQGLRGIVSSSFTLLTTVTSGIFSIFMALVFSIYLLLSKDTLVRQLSKMQLAFMKKEPAKKMNMVLNVTNESFSNFITGQCLEAVIIGTLCIIGMNIFGFPHPSSIGIFVGVTSLIPIFGAYLGAAVGALLIFVEDPIKALLFILFIIILQQLEGNLIYPKVVGTSIGLPGIWVFAAVTIGGGIGGVAGMLLSVPVMATVYKLLRIATNTRLEKQNIKS